MRVLSAIGILTATAAAVVGLAPVASAYNADNYSYAAGHMIQSSDIPASLQMKSGMNFSANPNTDKVWLCTNGGSSWIGYPGGTDAYYANYTGKKSTNGATVSESVMQYASFTDAQKAFQALTKQVKKCDGSDSGTQTYEDGSSETWARKTTSGSVPLVTVVGVESVFHNVNYTDTSSGSTYNSDNYQVFTLVNDVIISTSYYTSNELNISTETRKEVNQAAFNAVTRWLS